MNRHQSLVPPDPPPPGPTEPFVGRLPLPDGWEAYGPFIRFVLQVLLVTTLGVLAAKLGATFSPLLTAVALGVLAALFFAAALVRFAWPVQGEEIPVISIGGWVIFAAILIAAAVHFVGSGGSLLSFTSLLMLGAAWTVTLVTGYVNDWTQTLDWQETLGTAFGCLLLLVPTLAPARQGGDLLILLAGVANAVLALGMVFTYAEYVLSNPMHDRDTLVRAARWWDTVVWGQASKGLSPVIKAFATVILVSVVAVIARAEGNRFPVPQPIPANAAPPAAAAHKARLAEWCGLATAAAGIAMAVCLSWWGHRVWKARVVIRRALVLWMFYPATDQPGVFRPHRFVASRSVRQIAVAAVIVLNVLAVRTFIGPVDGLPLGLVLNWAAFTAQPPAFCAMMGLACFFLLLSVLAPVTLPIDMLHGISRELRSLHDQIENTAPVDLYPDAGEDADEEASS